MSKEKVSVA